MQSGIEARKIANTTYRFDIGTRVEKEFTTKKGTTKKFCGTVVDRGEEDGKDTYRIDYDDNDAEVLCEEDLEKLQSSGGIVLVKGYVLMSQM